MICACALRVAPPRRKSLAEAMLAECDHVSDADVLGFAAGCLFSAAGWWLATADGITKSARLVISMGSAALALLALSVAFRAWGGGNQSGALALAPIAIFYSVATLLSLRISLLDLGRYSLAGLILNTLALATVISLPPEMTKYGQFLRALVIEEYVILTVLFAFIQGARRIAHRLEAHP